MTLKYITKNQREHIMKRDMNNCRFCSSSLHLQIHHLNRNREDNNSRNLLLLCRKCHWKLHYECKSMIKKSSSYKDLKYRIGVLEIIGNVGKEAL